MAIISDGKGVWEEPEAAALEQPNPQTDTGFTPYSNISPSATEYGEALNFYNPGQMLMRRAERSAYVEHDWFRDFLAGNAAAYGSTVTSDDLYEPSKTISPDEANQKYAPPGQKLFDQPLPEKLAQNLGQTRTQQIQADSDIDRYENNHGLVNRMAVGAVANLVDPINISTLFLPGIGEEAMAARFGESFLGRTLARGIAGASLGVAQQAPVEFLKYQLGQSENDDYTIRRALSDTMSAAVFTAIPTMGFGAVGDLLRKATGEVRVPIEEKPTVDALTPALTADALTQDAARSTAVSQLVQGKPVDVADFFPTPPKTDTAIGMFLDHPYLPHPVGEVSEDIGRDELARQLEPDMFRRFDELSTRRDNLSGWYQDLSSKATDLEQQRAAEIADLEYRLPRARQKPLQRQIAARLAELQQTAQPAGAASPADIARVQQQMMQADYQMRDMGPAVTDAYKRADDLLAQQRLATTAAGMAQVLERQRQFSMPMMRPNFMGLIQREAAWRDIGTAPGISYSDLARAGQEVDEAAKTPPAAPTETKAPDTFGQPKAEPEETTPAAAAASTQPAKPPVAEAKPIATAPAVDTTGWLPEEKAELEAANSDVQKAGLYEQALEQAASCLMEAAG